MQKNIVLVGPPGCGKSTIGKILSNCLKKTFLDVDDFMEEENQRTVGSILEELGDDDFLDFEEKETLKINTTNSIISTSGSNPLRQKAMEHLQKNGILIYIDPPLKMIEERLERMKVDRIVGMKSQTIGEILKWRKENAYDKYDYDLHLNLEKPESSLVIAGMILGELDAVKYHSTRGDQTRYSFAETILKGLANDGGLLVPEYIPLIQEKTIHELRTKNYQDRAADIFKMFGTGFQKEEIEEIVQNAYGKNFDDTEIVPLQHLKKQQYILELWHGPTSAFKDMALQFKPLCFSKSIEKENQKTGKKKEYLILAATSGDTGKAALEGYKNREQVKIAVFYPKDGVSEIQRKQMITQEGNNLLVCGIEGNFDDAQTAVKNLFNNSKFNQELNQKNIFLSSANSINWGRILPQIFYYISAYLDILNKNIIQNGNPIQVAVPTGNFGNILAAFYAKKMGIPISKLICASNENDILTDFINTGIYDLNQRNLIKTSSPSMDILISSNLERLLFEITQDTEKVKNWMNDLKEKLKFEIDQESKQKIQKLFFARKCDNTETLKTIKTVYTENDYLMDPHTAVVQNVVEQYLKESESKDPIIIASTAHWGKFGTDVYRALAELQTEEDILENNEFVVLEKIKAKTGKKIPKKLSSLKTLPNLHNDFCSKNNETIQAKLRTFLN